AAALFLSALDADRPGTQAPALARASSWHARGGHAGRRVLRRPLRRMEPGRARAVRPNARGTGRRHHGLGARNRGGSRTLPTIHDLGPSSPQLHPDRSV
ncbi:MAG: hypothetical protein AVDCRST_MAG44-761, partial [uncultured Sphingomonas sp.]